MNDCLSKCSYSLPWKAPGSVPTPPTQRAHKEEFIVKNKLEKMTIPPVAFILHADPLELCCTYDQILFGSIIVTHKVKKKYFCATMVQCRCSLNHKKMLVQNQRRTQNLVERLKGWSLLLFWEVATSQMFCSVLSTFMKKFC